MALSGAWMRRAAQVNPMYSRWTTVDPRHEEDEALDARRADIVHAGPYQPTGPGPAGQLAPRADGSDVIDKTPAHAHSGTPMHPGMTLAELGAAHTSGLGADVAQTTTLPRLLKRGDEWQVYLTRDMTAPPAGRSQGSRADLVRGLNSFQENNPGRDMYQGEGWRRAIWQKPCVEHELRLPPRNHRFRVLNRSVAQSDTDSPGIGTQYGTPWPSLARAIRTNRAMPRLRRSPGPIDDDILSDGTGHTSASVGEFI